MGKSAISRGCSVSSGARHRQISVPVGEPTPPKSVPKLQTVISEPFDETDSQNARLNMKYFVRALVKYNATDLHLKVGRPPLFRINGKLVSAKMAELTSAAIEL